MTTSEKYDFYHEIGFCFYIAPSLLPCMRSILLIFLFLFCCQLPILLAQSVENINASFDGEKITVSYVLNYSEVSQKFKIELYSSHDNYSQPLQVTGDAGENVLPGRTKLVVWNAKESLPSDFDADVRIKIKAIKMAAPALAFEPLELKTYKKGRTISMKWTGGYRSDKVTIELQKNKVIDQRVAELIDNNGAYEWKMPKNVKGKNYQLVLTNASQKSSEPITSDEFRVKPRTPFIVKILPVLVAGVVAVILSGNDGGGSGSGGTVDYDTLPGPAKPGG